KSFAFDSVKSKNVLTRQRRLDRRHQNGTQIVGVDRTDELVGDASVAADDEGFRHAIDAPFDRAAAVRIGAGGYKRIAVAIEETARILRRILVVDADEADARILGKLHEERDLVVAGHAP